MFVQLRSAFYEAISTAIWSVEEINLKLIIIEYE